MTAPATGTPSGPAAFPSLHGGNSNRRAALCRRLSFTARCSFFPEVLFTGFLSTFYILFMLKLSTHMTLQVSLAIIFYPKFIVWQGGVA